MLVKILSKNNDFLFSDVQSTESKENSDSEGSRPRSIADDKKESSYDGYETPKSGLILFTLNH